VVATAPCWGAPDPPRLLHQGSPQGLAALLPFPLGTLVLPLGWWPLAALEEATSPGEVLGLEAVSGEEEEEEWVGRRL
jgi:hypothetical protein